MDLEFRILETCIPKTRYDVLILPGKQYGIEHVIASAIDLITYCDVGLIICSGYKREGQYMMGELRQHFGSSLHIEVDDEARCTGDNFRLARKILHKLKIRDYNLNLGYPIEETHSHRGTSNAAKYFPRARLFPYVFPMYYGKERQKKSEQDLVKETWYHDDCAQFEFIIRDIVNGRHYKYSPLPSSKYL